jgi:general nucleoside transport system ATP-binding protein
MTQTNPLSNFVRKFTNIPLINHFQTGAKQPTTDTVKKKDRMHSNKDEEPLVRMKGITCRFGNLTANQNINFHLAKGEIHALLGENGAGKTTLMSILYGLYQPEIGDIYIRGEPVDFKSPLDAIDFGIAMVHQHFLLTLPHTVTENIIVGLKSSRGIFLDTTRAEKKILELSKKYGLEVNPRAIVGNLSVGEQQRVEIIKALYRDVDILILDEPTSTLAPQEEEGLFAALQLMVKQGLSIIFITHKLREVMAVSTRVTILRNGKVIGTVNTSETSESDLAKLMMGHSVVQQTGDRGHGCVEEEAGEKKETILRVEDVTALNNSKIPSLRGLSLELRRGEIMGIAGVDGNGQTELAEVIAGICKVERGHIIMAGRSIEKLSPRKIREWGLAYVPEDLLATGLISEYTIAQNLILDRWYQKPYSGRLFLNEHEIRRFAEKAISDFDIRSPIGIDSAVRTLSGGNMQKVVLARELSRKPKVLVAHNPTRGLDIGATQYIHKLLIEQKESGVGVLLLSLELEEILSISDRIAVIFEGKIMGVFEKDVVDTDKIGLLIGGNLSKSGLQPKPPP